MNMKKIAGYKINIQKSAVFPHTNHKLSERESKKPIPSTSAQKRIKYQGINLPKKEKILCLENYKTLMKEIEDHINRCKGIPCS